MRQVIDYAYGAAELGECFRTCFQGALKSAVPVVEISCSRELILERSTDHKVQLAITIEILATSDRKTKGRQCLSRRAYDCLNDTTRRPVD